jgi:hypothetical protein
MLRNQFIGERVPYRLRGEGVWGDAPSLRHCLPLFSHLICHNVSVAHSPTLP